MTVVIDRANRPAASRSAESAADHARQRGDAGNSLYKPRTPIYPKLVHGHWRRIKWALLIVMLTIYYVTPWIRWPRPHGLPQQAVLVDFEGARFYFFGLQLWPQEVYFITGLLVMAALALFLVTALFGRLWCGYACPQTVWTDLYIYVERMFEGDRNARMRLDAAPWSLDKLWRKGGKHLVWLGVAFGTGGAWIFYFRDAPTLLHEFWTLQAPMNSYVSCLLLTGTTYLFAGHMREQVCTYMCPWPRIQGAMLDQHSVQVTYRYDRGEPRGAHKKGATWEGRGDCVDCNACVVACPMGIDIRNGPQLECINCALCIDACDEIMGRVGRPTGLIAYDTDAAVADREAGVKPRYKFLRPRTAYYAVALALVSGLMVWGLATRAPLELHVLRDRNPTFVRLHDGAIRNGYTLKIANKTFADAPVEVRFAGVPGAQLWTPGEPAGGAVRVVATANEITAVRVFVRTPPQELPAASQPAVFEVRGPRASVAAKTVFLSGAANP
ncbi:MAG: cytochrome c oxidase accessory protein CcoG [Phenylobacterium sp.]|uniref:cytochrome c oxidase accessory protein CcoG n=1 Tax=Phenylobacterium sp. TaxID=1871053 RepID=UPI001A4741E1|nr:cytochrome c oxidase accessory protein CcoG [Phenylobacterium sp.]MBL8555837.1 cytochrome c oxidase accessory protein CcoG [Phenylobacterium sp.]